MKDLLESERFVKKARMKKKLDYRVERIINALNRMETLLSEHPNFYKDVIEFSKFLKEDDLQNVWQHTSEAIMILENLVWLMNLPRFRNSEQDEVVGEE